MKPYEILSLENIRYELDGFIYEEQWKDIPDFLNLYMASNFSRIRRCNSLIPIVNSVRYADYNRIATSKIMKQRINNHGYLTVNLTKERYSCPRYVHRLIASAFVLNPDKKPQVNHINGIKHDNRIENLEWCTHLENHQHAADIGLMPTGENHHGAMLTEDDIKFIREKYVHGNAPAIAEILGIHRSTVLQIYHRKTWTHI